MPPTRPSTGTATPPYPTSRPGSSKPGTPAISNTANSSLLLRKQLRAQGRAMCGSAPIRDEERKKEHYMRPSNATALTSDLQKNPVDGFSAGLVDDDNILEWAIVIMGPSDTLYEGAILKARLIFPPEYPILPPKMIFDSEMWHPNVYSNSARKGEVCVSILHAPGEDEWGYEEASERWLPVHTVESVLISVISLLSADNPDLNSPANVDAAKQVREDYDGYKKKVKRLVRRSAEEAYD